MSGQHFNDLNFTNIQNGDVIQFNSTTNKWNNVPSSVLGESNTGNNVGGETGEIFRDKTGDTLNFKTISGGNQITITNNADTIDISFDTIVSGGAFVPTFSNLGGLSSVTVGKVWYTRIGTAVTCSFRCLPTPAGTGPKNFQMTIPVARTSGNFVGTDLAGGSCCYRNITIAQSKEGIINQVNGTQRLLVEFEVISSAATSILGGSYGYQLTN